MGNINIFPARISNYPKEFEKDRSIFCHHFIFIYIPISMVLAYKI